VTDEASMSLPATPDSVRTARRFVADRVEGWPEDLVADALLLTSELATNCVVHARSDYLLKVQVERPAVRVEVCDDDPDVPRVDDRGRGMRLVDELASAWGVEPMVDGPGKVVWFELRRPDE
jgi:anti-sigma regulatory factor (Ser/Thr protein kinase)